MSLPVDRDQRRSEVSEAAFEIVADAGLDGLTVRAVARALGCSTAVVSHYFANKRDLLIAVYRHATDATFAHWLRAEEAGGDLAACLASALPLDGPRQRLWRVNFAFWSVAARDPDLAAIQTDLLHHAEANIARLLLRDGVDRAPGDAGNTRLARQILALLMGIATQGSFGHDDMPIQWQASDLFDALERLISAPHS